MSTGGIAKLIIIVSGEVWNEKKIKKIPDRKYARKKKCEKTQIKTPVKNKYCD